MKFWVSYGSEHSSNLVMIGTFATIADAAKAKERIEAFEGAVLADAEGGRLDLGGVNVEFSPTVLDILRAKWSTPLVPTEMAQFGFEHRVVLDGKRLVLTSDESEVSAFMKVMLACGARVDVYSAHTHKGTGYGR